MSRPAAGEPEGIGATAADDFADLDVANASFFVEKLGAECGDLQALRELTMNGMQAIAALGRNAGGRVIWDLDWKRLEGTGGRVRKLSMIDTGIGMTPDALRFYINHLAASSHTQSRRQNFGVGAKIAAGSRNPHGLEYRSWHDGHGALVCFMRHPDGRWGLQPQTWSDGRTDFWRPLDEHDKPWALLGQRHGTQVVLLGQHERDDTTQAPKSVVEGRRQWITRHLNSRFFRMPSAIEVLVREGQAKTNERNASQLLRVHGQDHHLNQRAVHAGSVELSDALAHWWLLDDDRCGRRHEGTLWNSTGHAAGLFDGELYDQLPQTSGGYSRLHEFGIRFGYERVVLYLEPRVDEDRLEANTARTLLLVDHEPLPWARWAQEFAAHMPPELSELQERTASADGTPRREAIRARLAAHLPLYRLSRYRPPRTPTPPSRPARRDPTETPEHHGAGPAQLAPRSDHGPSAPASADATEIDFPDVVWVSVDDGTRAPGDLEDQAARYDAARHELTINADFRAITDMTSHWTRRYRGTPGARPVVRAQVREWFEQTLVEVVLCARNSHWDAEQLAALLCPSALSAAVLPRQLLYATLNKRLARSSARRPRCLRCLRAQHTSSRHQPSHAVPDAPERQTLIRAALLHKGLADARHRTALARRLGLTENEVLAVQHLARAGELTPGQLGALLQLSSGGTTALIHRLQRAGHMTREAHPRDGRRAVVRLKPDLQARATEACTPLIAEINARVEQLSESEADAVLQFLESIADAAARHADRLAADADATAATLSQSHSRPCGPSSLCDNEADDSIPRIGTRGPNPRQAGSRAGRCRSSAQLVALDRGTGRPVEVAVPVCEADAGEAL